MGDNQRRTLKSRTGSFQPADYVWLDSSPSCVKATDPQTDKSQRDRPTEGNDSLTANARLGRRGDTRRAETKAP